MIVAAIAAVAMIGVMVGGVMAVRASHRHQQRRWREYAEQLGLITHEASMMQLSSMHGEIDGYRVDIRQVAHNKATVNEVIVDARGGIPELLRLEEEGVWFLKNVLRGEDVKTGDDAFDRAVRVEGPFATVMAALSSDARRALMGFVIRGGRVDRGRVLMHIFAGESPVPGAREAIEVARLLCFDGTKLRERLAERLATEPDEGVRLQLGRASAMLDHPGEAGRLSIAPGDVGELSLASKDDGSLSITGRPPSDR